MRQPGVEPGSQPWEGCILPLYYWRTINYSQDSFLIFLMQFFSKFVLTPLIYLHLQQQNELAYKRKNQIFLKI